MSQQEIRVRFAPSPTGHLHIGGVRTALFNWFYAKNQGGKFFLRIEDTDQARSELAYEEEIEKSLAWLGIDWHDRTLHQADDLGRYQRAAQALIDKRCAERIDAETPAVIFHVDPDQDITFCDAVHGDISFKGKDVGDIVIIKSDGFPTYNFACVVDDHALKISHVIRGDDHIPNTPKQIALCMALGYRIPKYAHMPLIIGPDGSPLSKRHGGVSLQYFVDEGFSKEGLINYLSLLGWGAEGGNEFFSVEQIIKKFSLKRVNKTNATFDTAKLKALNVQHMKQLSDEAYAERAEDYCKRMHRDVSMRDADVRRRLFALYKGRAKTFKELLQLTAYAFGGIGYRQDAVRMYFCQPETKVFLCKILNVLSDQQVDFTDMQSIEQQVRSLARTLSQQFSDLIHPLRVAVVGDSVSPDLFSIMVVLGRMFVCERLQYVINHLEEILDA